jgi:hypothetical protein
MNTEIAKPKRSIRNTTASSEVREAFRRRQEDAAELKEQKRQERETKKHVKREIALLKYMLKTDVKYYHHEKSNSIKKDVERALAACIETNTYQEYNGYIYMYQTTNYMPRVLLGHLWIADKFTSIYDVPLDGTYELYCFDSGSRGLGSFHYMSVCKKGENPFVPKVSPGSFPPVTF